MRPLTCLLVLLAACAPLTEDNAPERLAETNCKKMRKCNADLYEDLYDSELDECVDEQSGAFEAALGIGGFLGLELDLDELRKCMSDIRSASCEEYNDGQVGNDCDDVLSF